MSYKSKTKEQLITEIHQLRKELTTACNKGNPGKPLLSDSFYRTLIDHSPVSTQILSPDGKTLHVNHAWEQLWGVPFEALADYNMLEDQQLIDRDIMPFIRKAFAGKAAEAPLALYNTAEVTSVHGDTGKRWLRAVIYPIKDEQGNVIEVILMHDDYTEQKQAEDALQNTLDQLENIVENRTAELTEINNQLKLGEERFSLAMRGANDGLWDWNLETDEVYYSPRWKSMLGYQEEELEASLDTWATLVHPDDKEWVLEKVQDYLDGQANSFEVEMRMRHKDGHEVVVLSRAFLVHRDSDSKPVRLVGTHVDITERKKSEQLILKSSNILKLIATGQPPSIIYNEIALMYEARHPGMRCSLLELKDNKLMHGGAPSLPKEYCDAVNGLKNGPNIGSCGTSTYTGKRVLVEDIATDPKWAALKDVTLPHGMRSCWSEPIMNHAGKVLGAFGMYYNHPALPNDEELRDLESAARLAGIIMERKRAEEERASLNEELKQKNKELEQIVYVTSHDLISPLVSVEGFSGELGDSLNNIMSVLDDEGLSSEIKERLDPFFKDCRESIAYVSKGASKMESLLNGLSQFSRSGRIEFNKEELDMNMLMSGILDSFFFQVKETGAKVEISELPPCSGDKQQITQLFTNLLSNAFKYCDPERPCIIIISSKKKDDRSVYCVEDKGIGIAPDYKERIFEIFHQLNPKSEGEGLGLSIVHKIVERHNGKIWVESETGRTTRFYIAL